MSIESSDDLYEICRCLPGVTEDVKWGNDLVFSVGAKMFAAFGLPDGLPFGFRVDPGAFEVLTQQPGIRPAPYLARHSWISVTRRDALPRDTVEDLLVESHALVSAKLSKRVRIGLGIETERA